MKMPTDADFELINELIQAEGTTPMGAYAMGMAQIACLQSRFELTRELLELVRRAGSIHEASRLISDYLRHQRRISAPRLSRPLPRPGGGE